MSTTMIPASENVMRVFTIPKLKALPKAFPSNNRPTKAVQPPKVVPKSGKMISTSNIFKKQRRQVVNKNKKKHGHKTKFTQELEKEMELMAGVKDGMKNARTRIMLKMTHQLNEVHKNHMATHARGKEEDANFLNYIASISGTLTAPLEKDQIESTINRNGKLVKEVAEMGKLMENFKNKIEAEKAELAMNWKKWDEVQQELARLGSEIFGIGDGKTTGKEGSRHEMEAVNAEQNARLAEAAAEIKAIGVETMEKVEATEKDLNDAAKKEQAKIIAAILEN
ncbi:hypothetical protein F5884DRAFT_766232 [Xylogone sp. PMI_703]|nr:hypothetical protein F5884DRAFT_766232 [Xylogone sp. PMI_703]